LDHKAYKKVLKKPMNGFEVQIMMILYEIISLFILEYL